MQIAQMIGGYTLGGADLLRRAMGKKKPEEMAKHRDIFVDGADEERPCRAEGRAALRPDGEVRGLRLQQVARRRLRAGRLPDRVLQGASPRRVHGGQHVARDGRHRQGAEPLRRRGRRSGLAVLPPDVNASALPLRAGRREAHPLRPRRDQGHRRGRDRRRSSPRARGRPVQGPVRFLPARRQATRQPPRGRGAGACGCVRRDRRASRHAAGVGRAGARCRRARRRPRASQVSLFGEETAATAGALVATREWTDAERLVAREVGARLLLVAVIRSRAIAAELAPVVRTSLADARAARRSRAGRGHRHGAARAVGPPRQDGVRHARRRQGPRRGDGLQRDVRRGARRCCARTSSW